MCLTLPIKTYPLSFEGYKVVFLSGLNCLTILESLIFMNEESNTQIKMETYINQERWDEGDTIRLAPDGGKKTIEIRLKKICWHLFFVAKPNYKPSLPSVHSLWKFKLNPLICTSLVTVLNLNESISTVNLSWKFFCNFTNMMETGQLIISEILWYIYV